MTDSFINPFDNKSAYVNSSLDNYVAPSPYLNDGSKNPIYHSTENSGNILADMDGKSNTEKILGVDNSYSTSWQTSDTIQNIGDNQYIHPSAQCCWRYRTVGTNQGDWYLPSAGELGYLAARWKTINNSYNMINRLEYGIWFSNIICWSSTECSHDDIIALEFFDSSAFFYEMYKENMNITIAFLAV